MPPLPHLLALSRAAARTQTRNFTTTPQPKASILFALSALSNSRETQHFNKLSHLSRTEHSPPLKLIKTSEIDPFPLPSKPVSSIPSALPPRSPDRSSYWTRQSLLAGRFILSTQLAARRKLSRAALRSKLRAQQLSQQHEKEKVEWLALAEKQRAELRAAGVWIVACVGVATGLAAWRFWPEERVKMIGRDSGVVGREIARRAVSKEQGAAALGGEGVGQLGAVVPGVAVAPVGVKAGEGMGLAPAAAVVSGPIDIGKKVERSWWKGLFWVQP